MLGSLSLILVFQIFVLLNPLESLPFLVSAYEKKLNVKIVAFKAVITAFIIALIITIVGPFMFTLFGITLSSFRIAGGVILFLLGIDMVMPKHTETSVTGIDALITLIATPMLTGPATISFITIKLYELGQLAVLVNLTVAFALVGITFFAFSLLIPKVNLKIVSMISRILGLFLTAIAVEMIAKGLGEILLQL